MSVWLNLIPQLHQPGDPEVSMRHHHFRERDPSYYAGECVKCPINIHAEPMFNQSDSYPLQFAGAVRAESFTRPKLLYPADPVNSVQESRQENYNPECTPDPTLGEALQDTEDTTLSAEDEEELLQKLATRHYYR